MPYDKNSPSDLAQRRDYHKRYYEYFRNRLYELLGGICMGCGHEDRRVLEFDHIHDDGAADRKAFKGSRSMLEWYARHPELAKERLQILCRNCNWLKRKGMKPSEGTASLVHPDQGTLPWDEYPG